VLDIKFILENKKIVERAVLDKRVDVDVAKLITVYKNKLSLQQELDEARRIINNLSRTIQKEKNSSKKEQLLEKAKKNKKNILKIEPHFIQINNEYKNLLLRIPNIPTEDTPRGKNEDDNKVIKKVGSIKKFSFPPKQHWELGALLNVIDTQRAVKISGSRFAFIKGSLVYLQFALIQYALSVITNRKILKKIITKNNLHCSDKPFIPIIPPSLIHREMYEHMARLDPIDDKYAILNEDLFLTGSAEHSLGPMHAGETLSHETLPIRYAGYSTCFRKEAGSYGKDMKGILRLHQFDKIEMECFTLPENGLEEQKLLVAIQEYLLTMLKIPYQVVSICTGDMGVPDAKQIDIEAWFPGQNKYRETHSADYNTDYQSRRLKTYVKQENGKKCLVHMNDATAFAIGRMLIAIMENYQKKDGSIVIPHVLRKYAFGNSRIEPL